MDSLNLSIINYNFENFLELNIDISKMDDYYLNIIINAIDTEYFLRNPGANKLKRIETKKTVIYFDIIHLCIGRLNNDQLIKWKEIIYTEYNNRLIKKNEDEEYLNKICNYIKNKESYSDSS